MNENNGFVVNTEIDEKPIRKTKKQNYIIKFIKRNIIFVGAAVLVIALLFCATIPICKEYRIHTKTATGADSAVIEIDYFNKDGLVEKNEKFTNGEVYCVTENKYKGDKIIESDVSYFGDLFEKTVYEYKGKNLIKKSVSDAGGNPVSEETFFYDEDNVLINSVVTDENGVQSFRYDYIYEKGKLVKKVLYDIEYDYTRATTYTYEKGRLVSEKVTAGAYHNSTTEYTYNSKGHVAMQKSNSLENGYISYTYEYRIKRVTVFGKIF